MSTVTLARRLGLGVLVIGLAFALTDRFGIYTTGIAADNRVAVLTIAVITVVLGLWYAFDYTFVDREWWRPPDPEPGHRVPVPGEEFTALPDTQLKDRFRHRAIVSLIDATDCSRSEAEAHLEAGTWTDDSLAVSYLSDGVRISLLESLVAKLRGESISDRARRRTVAAIRAVRDGEVDIQ